MDYFGVSSPSFQRKLDENCNEISLRKKIDYHREQIKILESLLIKQKNDARVLEITEKYPLLYAIEEHVSGYVDYVSYKACFVNEQIAKSKLNEYERETTTRFNVEYVICERTSTSLPNDLLLNMSF
jgi:hypothetical protein